jgi:hypothetical protein
MADGAAAGTPFFLSLHYTAPHWPWETRDDEALAQEVKDNLFHLHGGNIHTYRRMIHHMDEGIGRLMAALRATGWTATRWWSSPATTAASASRQLAAGGRQDGPDRRRHPRALDRALARRDRARRRERPALHDHGLVGHDARRRRRAARPGHPLDGVSLLPVLHDPTSSFRRPLFWRMNHRGQRALRDGDWKYLRVDGHDYLFNIPADERERANLRPRARAPGRHAPGLGGWNATMPPIPEMPRSAWAMGEGHAAALNSSLPRNCPRCWGSRVRWPAC